MEHYSNVNTNSLWSEIKMTHAICEKIGKGGGKGERGVILRVEVKAGTRLEINAKAARYPHYAYVLEAQTGRVCS